MTNKNFFAYPFLEQTSIHCKHRLHFLLQNELEQSAERRTRRLQIWYANMLLIFVCSKQNGYFCASVEYIVEAAQDLMVRNNP